MMTTIATFVLGLFVLANTAQGASCLESLKTNPSAGYINVDEIYYELQEAGLSQWQETFAFQTLRALESRLGSESCEPLNVSIDHFVCKKAETVVCVANDREGDLSVAVVKDYVDSANVVVLDRTKHVRSFPEFLPQNAEQELWVPSTSACYGALLNDYSGDSAAFSVNVRDYLWWSEGRFVFAAGLRKLVRGLALQSEDCVYKKLTLTASDLNCREFGAGITACALNNTGAGFFEMFKRDGSDTITIVFNRWD